MESQGDVDVSKLSLEERVGHKLWKVRLNGWEDLCKIFHSSFDEDDPNFSRYGVLLKVGIDDVNAMIQEKSLEALELVLIKSTQAKRLREDIVPILIDKCLATPKASIKAKAFEAFFLFMEKDIAEPVIEEIIKGCNKKQPKIVAVCFNLLSKSLEAFGTKLINPKPLLKILPLAFQHSDKSVRDEGTNLAIQLYSWIGDALKSIFDSLKPVQLKQLEDQLASVPKERPVPTRLPRSHDPSSEKNETVQKTEPEASGEHVVDNEFDAYSLAEPQDILGRIPKTFFDEMASSKWKDRKDALDNLYGLLKAPRFKNGNYGELAQVLKKCLSDSNILVVIVSANCLERLAHGLRQDFTDHAKNVVSDLLDRLKEKKQNVVAALRSALDALLLLLTLSDLQEVIQNLNSVKNPQQKSETFLWICRSLKSMTKEPTKAEIKSLAEVFSKSIDDGASEVRDTAAEGLGILMKLVGDQPLMIYLDKMDKSRQSKIRDFCEKAEIKLRPKKILTNQSNQKVTSLIKPTSSPKPLVLTSIEKENDPKLINEQKTKLNSSQPLSSNVKITSKPPTSQNFISQKPKSKPSQDNLKVEIAKLRFSPEEIDMRFEQLVTENIRVKLGDSAWKQRLEGCEELLIFLQTTEQELDVEIVARALKKKPGIKESNFQVVAKVFAIFERLAHSKSTFNQAVASELIPWMIEKIGDSKLKACASDCLLLYSEVLSLQFILKETFGALQSTKSPKIISDGLAWICTALAEFGLKNVQARLLIDFTKTCLDSSNPSVRINAISLLGVIRLHMGQEVRQFVEDLKPSLLASIDAEFSKWNDKVPDNPTRFERLMNAAGKSAQHRNEELLPLPTDLSVVIDAQLLKNLTDPSWKIRNEALEQLNSILLTSKKRIKSTLGPELMPILKARLNDPNRNICVTTLNILGSIAESMGPPFERHCKVILGPLLNCLSDTKPQVRNACLQALDSIRTAVGIESLIPHFVSVLESDSSLLRKGLLEWLNEKFENISGLNVDLSSFLKRVLSCLEDRHADVRKFAQNCLMHLAGFAGMSTVRRMIEAEKPNSSRLLLTLLEKNRDKIGQKYNSTVATSEVAGISQVPVLTPLKTESKTHIRSDPYLDISKSSGKSQLIKDSTGSLPIVTGNLNFRSPNKTEDVPPLIDADLKAKEERAEYDKRIKWYSEQSGQEFADVLKRQMEGHVSPELIHQCFSADFREHLNVLSSIDDAVLDLERFAQNFGISVTESKLRIFSCSDLILKYIALKFYEFNASVHLKCMDFLEHFFEFMDKENQPMMDCEATVFLPFLINQMGNSKETLRHRIRAILRSLCRIYPASKVFSHLTDGLKTKNSLTKSECLEEIGYLIRRHGIDVCHISNTLSLVTAAMRDSDTSISSAAKGVLLEVYAIAGDPILKLAGKFDHEDLTSFLERLKHASGASRLEESQQSEKHTIGPSNSSSDVFKDSKKPLVIESSSGFSKTIYSSLEEVASQKLQEHTKNYVEVSGRFSSISVESSAPKLMRSSQDPVSNRDSQEKFGISPSKRYLPEYLIDSIDDLDISKSIDALKQIEAMLYERRYELFVQHVPKLVYLIATRLRASFSVFHDEHGSQISTRYVKHQLSCLIQIFCSPLLAKKVSKQELKSLMKELVSQLLDNSINQLEQPGLQLAKALNVLMIKILENAERTDVFCSLLETLDTACSTPRSLNVSEKFETKFIELLMKCLWKLTKSVSDDIHGNNLKVMPVLQSLHQFLEKNPPSMWRRKAADGDSNADLPLRTVKTIIHELVTSLGADISPYLKSMELCEDDSLTIYVKGMLAHLHSSDKPVPKDSSLNAHASDEGSSSQSEKLASKDLQPTIDTCPSSTEPESDVLIPNSQLSFIFGKIRSKQTSKEGLRELYIFQKHYPDTVPYVEEFLSKSSEFFRNYIRRGLLNLAEETLQTPIEPQQSLAERNKDFVHSPVKMNEIPSNPSAISHSDDFMGSYKLKMVKLQQLYGIKSDKTSSSEEIPATLPISHLIETSSSSPSNPQLDVSHPSHSEEPVVPSTMPTETDTTLISLKERLERIRMGINSGSTSKD